VCEWLMFAHSRQVDNTRHLMFTANCQKSNLSPRCRTIIPRLWLIAENFKATLAVRSSTVPDLPQSESNFKLRIRSHKVTNPNPFTNPDLVTNQDAYTNLDLVTNPNPITNPDLETTPPTPRSLLMFAVRFFILADKLEAELLKNAPDMENQFYIDKCSNLSTLALRRAIFKRKKGFSNLSLDLF
jgi:hypothetical protein